MYAASTSFLFHLVEAAYIATSLVTNHREDFVSLSSSAAKLTLMDNQCAPLTDVRTCDPQRVNISSCSLHVCHSLSEEDILSKRKSKKYP